MREQGESGVLASVVSRGGATIFPRGSKVLFGRGEKWGFLSEGEVFEGQIRRWCEENPLKALRLHSFETIGYLFNNPTAYPPVP